MSSFLIVLRSSLVILIGRVASLEETVEPSVSVNDTNSSSDSSTSLAL